MDAGRARARSPSAATAWATAGERAGAGDRRGERLRAGRRAASWRWRATSSTRRARPSSGMPEVGLGVIPGFGGTQRLALRVGVARARELIYSGAIIDADEALRIGLVQRRHGARRADAAGARARRADRRPRAARGRGGEADGAPGAPREPDEPFAAALALERDRFGGAVRDRGSKRRHAGVRREATARRGKAHELRSRRPSRS